MSKQKPSRRVWWMWIALPAALAATAVLVWRPWEQTEEKRNPNVPPPPGAGVKVQAPGTATVFGLCELKVQFGRGLEKLAALPDTQVHDAYDADRDGAFIRLSAFKSFSRQGPH